MADRIQTETKRARAILVVSFGTSYEETRKRTIDRIEVEIHSRYPQYALYRAWTSKMIIRKVEKRDGIHMFTVTEAMEQMLRDGIREVVVQPTHVINGIENDQMRADLEAFSGSFDRIAVGAPLLTSGADNHRVIETVVKELQPKPDEALVLMGHGTEHYANAIYAALDYQFKDLGYPNVFMGTVEAYPAIESLLKQIQKTGLGKVKLAPFMIVAGDHATNDLSGDEEDSWKSVFERAGYTVSCVVRGLGEYQGIRELFLDHIAAVL